MRYGAIPQGLHADYEKGLGFLRRLLSLDRDNVRLLTALVEVCNEWFLDLYNLGPSGGLGEQVERFTPFALQLARLVEDKPGDLAARAQLADFYKFRGFVSRDREQKLALYREALRFNPGNNNDLRLIASNLSWDTSASYKINDNFTVTFQGINLSNEPVISYLDSVGQRLNHGSWYGTEYYLGLRYAY